MVTVPDNVSFQITPKRPNKPSPISKRLALIHIGISHDRTLAKEVPSLDVIIGGHSHVITNPSNQIGDTLIVQTGEYDTNLGELNLVFDEKGKNVGHSGKLHSIKNADIHPGTVRVQELFDEATALGIVSYEDFIGYVIKAGELGTYEAFIE